MTEDGPADRGQAADDVEYADPGLARERTRLAWTRSAISFAAIGAAISKARPLIGVPLLVLSALIWLTGRMRQAPDQASAAASRVKLVTIGVIVVAVVALVIVFAGRSPNGFKL